VTRARASKRHTIPSKGWGAYAFAASAVGVSVLSALALHPWFNLRGYLFFIPGIVFVARWGGFRPGLFATLLSAAAIVRWLLPGATALGTAEDVGALLLFIAVGASVSALCESLRRALGAANRAMTRTEAVLARERLLAEAIRLLGTSLETDQSFRQLADIVVPSLADACGIHVISEDGVVRAAAVKHRDPALQDVLRAFATREAAPAHGWGRVLSEGVPELMPEVTERIRQEGRFDEVNRERLDRLGFTSQISVPLVARGRTLGALTLSLGPGARRYTDADLAFATEIAAVAAIAIDNGSLYERALRHERVLADSVREAESARGHSEFISGVGRRVTASIELEHTVQAAVDAAVPRLADSCRLLLRGEAGELREMAAAARGGREAPPLPPHALADALAADRTGEARVAPPTAVSGAALALPLSGREGTIGVLYLAMAESGRAFSPADIRLAGEFGERVGTAVEHARLFRAAQESNRVKDEFLSTLSHELRTPLNAVLGWSRMLAAGQIAGAAAQRAAEGIYRNARLQLRLVEDILDVARGLAGKLHLERAPVDMAAIVEMSVSTALASAAGKRLTIEKRLPAAPIVVNADEGRLRQIVDNLVSNAVKFTLPGGRIVVSLSDEAGTAALVVSDNGIGIPADFLPHVFERFRQADASSTRSHGGLGLGLSIVRQLVQLHGGSVTAESDGRDQGAAFTVRLPLAHGEGEALEIVRRPEGDALLAGIPILIVDDDRDHLQVAADVLSSQGAAVAIAVSADDAEGLLDARVFRLLVVDLSMPVTDGFTLLGRVRSRPAYRSVPAIALSADVSEHARRRAQAAGFTVHVAKPFDAAELVDLARSLTNDTESAARSR
jgi:signal transduction histidine kinase/ActR/RegA family two-component response regulator